MLENERPTNTGDLEKTLQGTLDLSEFLKESEGSFTNAAIGALLEEIIAEKKLSKAQVAKNANTSRVYLFQILNGSRTPSRDRVLSLCVSLGLGVDETRSLLRRACYGDLYVKSRRDSIIAYGLKEHWDLNKINDALFDEGEETLV